ncbi:MAG TPA: hypothetical protein PKA15_09950 [Chitinophagales bacterium]|jgi:hypothetical protein|nr:hypothetical protein [Chitinophagales bacterium]HMY41964.1 hypothetical protein [Chitinophagales bacterium]
MKLYECKPNTKIKIIGTDAILTFQKIDGMYSICKNEYNETVHLAAWTEVELL